MLPGTLKFLLRLHQHASPDNAQTPALNRCNSNCFCSLTNSYACRWRSGGRSPHPNPSFTLTQIRHESDRFESSAVKAGGTYCRANRLPTGEAMKILPSADYHDGKRFACLHTVVSWTVGEALSQTRSQGARETYLCFVITCTFVGARAPRPAHTIN